MSIKRTLAGYLTGLFNAEQAAEVLQILGQTKEEATRTIESLDAVIASEEQLNLF